MYIFDSDMITYLTKIKTEDIYHSRDFVVDILVKSIFWHILAHDMNQ